MFHFLADRKFDDEWDFLVYVKVYFRIFNFQKTSMFFKQTKIIHFFFILSKYFTGIRKIKFPQKKLVKLEYTLWWMSNGIKDK